MENIKELVHQFFDEYLALYANALKGDVDAKAVAAKFAACFIESSPVGVNCAKNDAAFLEGIPGSYDYYRKLGTKQMLIDELDIAILDEYHVMAKVRWNAVCEKDGKEINVRFGHTYFMNIANNTPLIFAYIAGDQEKILKEYGLI